MNAKEIHKLDESIMDIKIHFIPILKTFFDSCVKEGFTKAESMELTIGFLHIPNREGKGQ